MTATELAAPENGAIELAKPAKSPMTSVVETTYGLTDSEYAILLKTTCKDAPREMAGFFLAFCKRAGLDPFRKHVYLWKQKDNGEDKWQIVTGIDGLRVIASRNSLYRGQSEPTWEYVLDENGKPATFRAEHSKYGGIAGKRMPLSCTVVVYRAIGTLAARGIEQRDLWLPFYGIARFDEFVKKRDGKIHGNWENQPEHQLRIRAEAMALRMAFPEDVGGIYLEDELADRDGQTLQQPAPTATASTTRAAELRERLAQRVRVVDAEQTQPQDEPSKAEPDDDRAAADDAHEAVEPGDPDVASSDPNAEPPASATLATDQILILTSDTPAKIKGDVDLFAAQKIVEMARDRGLTETALVAVLVENTKRPQLSKKTIDAAYAAVRALPLKDRDAR
jgi:phage recombination protein Bet